MKTFFCSLAHLRQELKFVNRYPLMISIVTGLVIFGMVKTFIHKAAGK